MFVTTAAIRENGYSRKGCEIFMIGEQ